MAKEWTAKTTDWDSQESVCMKTFSSAMCVCVSVITACIRWIMHMQRLCLNPILFAYSIWLSANRNSHTIYSHPACLLCVWFRYFVHRIRYIWQRGASSAHPLRMRNATSRTQTMRFCIIIFPPIYRFDVWLVWKCVIISASSAMAIFVN